MSVPAHDERDYEFARKYGLEIRLVILPQSSDPEETMAEPELPFTTMDGFLVNSGECSGINCADAIPKMAAFAEGERFWQSDGHIPIEGLGSLPATLLGHADPDGLLRERRHRAGAGEQICR